MSALLDWPNWCREGALSRPSELRNSVEDAFRCNAGFLGPRGNRLCPSGVLNQMVVAPVSALFDAGRPTAIVGRIWAGIVDAIKARAVGTRLHVTQELLELMPCITDVDPTASVVAITSVRWSVTPAVHRLPHSQHGTDSSAGRVSMSASLPKHSTTETSATAGQTIQKIPCLSLRRATAFTLARPVRSTFNAISALSDGQFAEHSSSQVDEVGHGGSFYQRIQETVA